IVAIRNSVNINIANTLNKGIDIAQGKYIARMDNDDWSYPDRLLKQLQYMETNPQIVISGGTIDICDDSLAFLNKRKYNVTDLAVRNKIFQYSPFCHSSTIFKAAVAKLINGYNPDLAYAEDYDLYFRLGKHGKFGNISDTILKLRTHKGSMSQSRGRHQEILTLYIRLKAVTEYGYTMPLKDKIYFVGQYLSTIVIPYRLKFRLFNLMRSLK
ncbi:glycosyltransferase, partial [Candidatus Microgenomates bacterium]|nr:glycosyltransferase [Candidatus Microgenomates bacterium]